MIGIELIQRRTITWTEVISILQMILGSPLENHFHTNPCWSTGPSCPTPPESSHGSCFGIILWIQGFKIKIKTKWSPMRRSYNKTIHNTYKYWRWWSFPSSGPSSPEIFELPKSLQHNNIINKKKMVVMVWRRRSWIVQANDTVVRITGDVKPSARIH